MGLWWCKHRNGDTGVCLSVLHGGKQCSSDNSSDSCVLCRHAWTFIGCRPAKGVVVERDDGTIDYLHGAALERELGSSQD